MVISSRLTINMFNSELITKMYTVSKHLQGVQMGQYRGTTYLNSNHNHLWASPDYVKKCTTSVHAAHGSYMLAHMLGGAFRLQ